MHCICIFWQQHYAFCTPSPCTMHTEGTQCSCTLQGFHCRWGLSENIAGEGEAAHWEDFSEATTRLSPDTRCCPFFSFGHFFWQKHKWVPKAQQTRSKHSATGAEFKMSFWDQHKKRRSWKPKFILFCNILGTLIFGWLKQLVCRRFCSLV